MDFFKDKGVKVKEDRQDIIRNTSSVTSQNNNGHKGKRNITIVATIVTIIVIYLITASIFCSKNYQAKEIARAISDPKQSLVNYVVGDDHSAPVTDENTRQLHKVSKIYRNTDSLVTALKDPGSVVGLVQDGHKWLFFPRYKLQLPTQKVHLLTNYKNATFYVDGKNIGKGTKDEAIFSKESSVLGNKGNVFQAKATIGGRQVVATSRHIDHDDSNQVELWMGKNDFKVKGMPNSIIYIDGKKAGRLNSKGIKAFKGYPVTVSTTVKLVTHKDGRNISSKPTRIYNMVNSAGNDDNVVQVTYPHSVSEGKVNSLLVRALNPRGLIKQESNSSNDLVYTNDKSFIGGKNSTSYKQLQQYITQVSKKDDFDQFTGYGVNIESLQNEGSKDSIVRFKVTYKMRFFEDDGDVEKVTVLQFNHCLVRYLGRSSNGRQIFKIKSLGQRKTIKDVANLSNKDNKNEDIDF